MRILSISPSLCGTILSCILWLSSASGVPHFTWIYPEPDSKHSYNYKDSVLASWDSNFPNPYFSMLCTPDINNLNGLTVCSNSSVNATGNSLTYLDNSVSSPGQPFTGDPSCGPNVTCAFAVYSPNNSQFFNESTLWTITQDEQAEAITWSASATIITNLPVSTTQKPSSVTTTMILYATLSLNTTTSASRTSLQSSSTPTFSSSSSGPSQGAAAGIGISAAVAFVIAVAAVFLFFRRRHQKLQRKRGSASGLMDVKAPEEFDPKPRVLEEVQQPAVGELGIDPPTLPPGELDASPITLEIGSPKSPIEERQGIAEREMVPDEERVIGEPNVAVDKKRTVLVPDAAEDEEIRIGESIRTGDE